MPRTHASRPLALALLSVVSIQLAHSAEPSVADQVKAIARRFDQVEEQLPRSVRYAKTEQTADGTVVTQAWFNGAGDRLKVATERTSPQGRELTETVAIDKELTDDGVFVLTRKEMPASDGGTQVEETRRYYGQATYLSSEGDKTSNSGVLIRELKKSAHFGPGEPLDTSKTPNTTVALPKGPPPELTREEEGGEIAFEMQQAGNPAADPFANLTGDSDRFRVIHGTASPDGRYAIAIGFEQPVDWDKYNDGEVNDVEVFTVEDVEEEHLKNYLVDLTTKKIIGDTGGDFIGTRRRYNHRECVVTWSLDSATFVETFHNKWNYESCHAGRIAAGPKLVTVNLGPEAEKHAKTFLKNKKNRYDGSIALDIKDVANDGTIQLNIAGQSPSVPNKGEIYFNLDETLRLREAAAGLKVEFLKARVLPNDL